MEFKLGTKQILAFLMMLSWIIFAGLGVEAGGILFNMVYALYKPGIAKYFWTGADLSALYTHDKGQFLVQTGLMFIAAILKWLIFYLIVGLFHNKTLSITQPFKPAATRVVFRIAWLCLGAGIFSYWGVKYAAWIKTEGIPMPDIELLRLGGADVWIFMAVVLIIIGQVFKKGTELQTESELTV